MAENNNPTPDPTVATQDRFARSPDSLRLYVDGKFETLMQRLEGMDKATKVLDESLNRTPTDIEKAVGALENVINVHLKAQKESAEEREKESIRELDVRLESLDTLTDTKFVTLKTVVDSNAKQVALALDSADKAITKSEIATDKRFESVNEFRGSLSDLSERMASRRELEQAVTEVKGILTEHAKQLAEYRSRLDTGPTGLAQLEKQYAVSQGMKAGSEVTIGKIYAAIGVVGAVLGIMVLLVNGVFN